MLCLFKKKLKIFPKDKNIKMILPLEIGVVNIDESRRARWPWGLLLAKVPCSLAAFPGFRRSYLSSAEVQE